MENAKKKFYQKNWFLWLWLMLFPPIGLILLWACHRSKKKITKIILSVVFIIWFIILMSATNSNTADPATSNVPTTEQIQSTKQKITSEKFLTAVKEVVQEAISSEGESITGVVLKDEDLCVTVDLSNANPEPFTLGDLAWSRASSITDAILELAEYDNLWNTITLDFGDIGRVTCNKADIAVNEYGGRYFPAAGNFDSLIGIETSKQENEANTAALPFSVENICRALTKIFIEGAVGEKYSMLAFNVKEFELDNNGDGTIKILYLPSNAGKEGATKVNLTISKTGNTYTIEYALLAGLYEIELSDVADSYKVWIAE